MIRTAHRPLQMTTTISSIKFTGISWTLYIHGHMKQLLFSQDVHIIMWWLWCEMFLRSPKITKLEECTVFNQSIKKSRTIVLLLTYILPQTSASTVDPFISCTQRKLKWLCDLYIWSNLSAWTRNDRCNRYHRKCKSLKWCTL